MAGGFERIGRSKLFGISRFLVLGSSCSFLSYESSEERSSSSDNERSNESVME